MSRASTATTRASSTSCLAVGGIGGNEKITFAHEFTHALQDQTWTVFKDQKDVLDRSDWIMGRQAVFEGDATVLMTQWAIAARHAAGPAGRRGRGLGPGPDRADGPDPGDHEGDPAVPVHDRDGVHPGAPRSSGDWAAVDKLYDRMPELDRADHASGEVRVERGAGRRSRSRRIWPSDWGPAGRVPLEDTFGEFQTGIWLREGGVDTAAANAAMPRRLGRRSPGGHRRSRTAPGPSPGRPPGTRQPTRRRSRRPRRRRLGKAQRRRAGAAGRGRQDPLGPGRERCRTRWVASRTCWNSPADRPPATSSPARRSPAGPARSPA